MTFSKPVKVSSKKWLMRMCAVCSMVFHRQPGPPLAKVALICSTWPGSGVCPAETVRPSESTSGLQDRTGTTESRGKLSTTARLAPGEMCTTMTVSERWPLMPTWPPIWPFLPERVSEPIIRMLSALGSSNGRLVPFRSPEVLTCSMASQIARYLE